MAAAAPTAATAHHLGVTVNTAERSRAIDDWAGRFVAVRRRISGSWTQAVASSTVPNRTLRINGPVMQKMASLDTWAAIPGSAPVTLE